MLDLSKFSILYFTHAVQTATQKPGSVGPTGQAKRTVQRQDYGEAARGAKKLNVGRVSTRHIGLKPDLRLTEVAMKKITNERTMQLTSMSAGQAAA